MVDFKICPGPIHCEGCAGNAELTALRTERDALRKELKLARNWGDGDAHNAVVLEAGILKERDALRARIAELTRLGNAMHDGGFAQREAWRKAVRG